MAIQSQCDICSNYVYDELEEYYYCDVNLDEDEMYRFMKGSVSACPYFNSDDEYKLQPILQLRILQDFWAGLR